MSSCQRRGKEGSSTSLPSETLKGLQTALQDNYSLRYTCTVVTSRINDPECTAAVLVDGEQCVNIYSKAETQHPYSNTTQIQQTIQEIFSDNGVTANGNINQTEVVHTVQVMYGCELDDNGTKRGYKLYGYDGEDYISLDMNTHTWTPASDNAKITKLKWDLNGVDKAYYLETNCTEWLQKYVSDGTDTLERKVPPEVTVFQKDSSSPVVCHTTGFFPRGVEISWQKNGEDLQEDVELTETLPNQDGTFQKRSNLTVSPEELDRNEYTCVVQHSGLEKDLVLRVTERRVLNTGGVSSGVIVGVIIGVIIGVVGVSVLLLVLTDCVKLFIWRKKKNASDGGSSSTNPHDCIVMSQLNSQASRGGSSFTNPEDSCESGRLCPS
ncbi:BOLA class I histocompatibility antigen, alpha chain BL3-7-like [Brachyhypopomus gauderio]|uniref:BOLA class I histocompatibility antigen, alpha chain BL3-7-like n=1 Tax=Brachyhypopomus gauderio TaxID=698409 RepID=UPI00404286B8